MTTLTLKGGRGRELTLFAPQLFEGGVQAQAAGNVLVLVLCFALDRPLTPDQALVAGLVFTAGGLWATLLALLLWRLHPYRPTHRAVAEVWRRLTRLCDDLEDLGYDFTGA